MKGRPFLVFFSYTHCPDICPTTLFEISEVMKALGKDADRTRALFITIDPERDTPAALKDYLSNFDPHLRGLTGDRAAVDAALKAYRVYAKKIPLKDGDYTNGSHGRRLSHGQRRPLRRDIQSQSDDRGGRRPVARLSIESGYCEQTLTYAASSLGMRIRL